MILKDQTGKSSSCGLSFILVILFCLPPTYCHVTNLSTFSQVNSWYPPILEVDVPSLIQILPRSGQIKHLKPDLFEATLDETIHEYFIRINCILDEDVTVNFDSLTDALDLMQRINQNKSDSVKHTTAYLSIVPGLQNASGYIENLARISETANASTGAISHVFLDLSSVDVGPLDGFSLNQRWTSCKEAGDIQGFKCGFIFDIRFCPDKMSVFGHIRARKFTPVFLSTGHGTWKDVVAAQDPSKTNVLHKCLLAINLSGMKFTGVMDDDEKMELNSTQFLMDNFAKMKFMGKSLRRISPANLQNHGLQPDCHLQVPRKYSNLSGNQSTTAVIAIRCEDLLWSLSQDPFVLDNSTFNGIPFLELFHRFVVMIPSVEDISDSSHGEHDSSCLTELLASIQQHSEKHKETYHLRPLELWISFTPEESLQKELTFVKEYVKHLNSKLSGTVTTVVLDYNNLRTDSSSVLSVVKSDVMTCNTVGNESGIRCGFIFQGRNCRFGSNWLKQLPFQDDSVVLFRGKTQHIKKCLSVLPHVQFGLLSEHGKLVKIDTKSKSVTIPSQIIQLAQGALYLYVPTIPSSYEMTEATYSKPSYSETWLHSPVNFPKNSVGFVATLDDLMNKVLLQHVTSQNNLVIRVNSLTQAKTTTDYNLTTFCHIHSQRRFGQQISILIQYHPDLAKNLELLDEILSDIYNTNLQCGNVISEILIDWDSCFVLTACINASPTVYTRDHFAGLAGVTKYIDRIKKTSIKTGLFISSRTIVFLSDASNFVTGRWAASGDGEIKDRALRLPSLFNVSEVLFMLDQFDLFVYKTGVTLYNIFNTSAYEAAKKSLDYFETYSNYMTLVETRLFPNSQRSELVRFKLRVSHCDVGKPMLWNETLEYARFWEMLSNWADKMGLVLIIDNAYQSSSPERCLQVPNGYECACGWWTLDNSSGQYLDRKARGVFLMNKALNKKALETDISTNYDILWSLPFVSLLLVALCIPLVAKFHKKKNSTFSKELRKLVSDFPSNAEPELDMSSSKLIGQGSSKTLVYKGKLNEGSNKLDVAVKTFKLAPGSKLETENMNALRGLISEAKTLRDLTPHPNVVKYFGICIANLKQGALRVVLEYCSLESMNKVLPSLQTPANSDYRHVYMNQLSSGNESTEIIDRMLLKWSIEISAGLEHLVSHNIVHADIATRNILLDQQMCCKLCDFGLSRRMEKYQIYVKDGEEPLPWRWMAPESLRKLVFNEKTDVWMFGVTLWEIYTFGEVPHGGLSWSNDFVRLLDGGLRLELPSRMPARVKQLVMECHELEVDNRPTFSDCKSKLSE